MQCPECNATVSNDIASCPKCGAPLPSGPPGGQQGGGQGQGGQPAGGGQPQQGRGQPPQGQPQAGGHGHQGGGQPRGGGQQAPAGQPAGGTQQGAPQGQPQAGGQATQGGQPQQPAQPQAGGAGYGRAPAGPTLADQAKDVVSRLPWKGGAIAGGLYYLLGILAFGFLIEIGASFGNFGQGVGIFAAILTFNSVSSVLGAIAATGLSLPRSLATGQYDLLLGLLYFLFPWLLYATGKKFAGWYITDPDDILGHVLTGTTVAVGTFPLMLLAGVALGLDVGQTALMAGLLMPAGAGALGGTLVWAFRDYSRGASYGSGLFLGLVGVALLFGLTFLWSGGSAFAQNPMLSRLVAALLAFVGVVSFGFNTGGVGLLAYIVVPLPLVLLGFTRAKRSADDVTDPLDGARAGGSLVAGFSTFVFLALVAFIVLGTFGQGLGITPGAFLPQPGGVGAVSVIPQFAAVGALLKAFLIGGVLFPILFGAIGGAIGGYLSSPAGAESASGGQQAGGGQPTAASQSDQQAQAPQAGAEAAATEAEDPDADAGSSEPDTAQAADAEATEGDTEDETPDEEPADER